jgi:hypothetical protein
MAMVDAYLSEMHKQTKMHATWPLETRLEIGDFGELKTGQFNIFGRLTSKEISRLNVRESAKADWDITFKSHRNVYSHTEAQAKAKIATGKALLEITFDSEESFMFTSPNTLAINATDIRTLGDILKARLDKGDWDLNHVIIVGLSNARAATVLLSDQQGASIQFELDATTPPSPEVVATLNSDNSLINYHGVGIRLIGRGPLTPLYKAAKLHKTFWLGDLEVRYRGEETKPEESFEIDREYSISVY